MENINMISINRKGKNIIIYVKDRFMNGMAEMVIEEIVDVEIFNELSESSRKNEVD